MIGSRSRFVGVVLASAVLVVTGAVPALADEESPDSVAEQASAVAPYIGETEPASTQSGAVIASGEGITLTASSDLADGIEVTGPGDVAPLVVEIGFGAETAAAEVASDGSVVYESDAGEDVVVQATSDAVRIQTVISEPAELHEIPYSFGDGFIPTTDGTNVFITDGANPNGSTVYSVEQPWAFDALGAPVETYFEIREAAMVQVVVPSAMSVYPIVADPTLKWVAAGFGAQFTRTETRDIANQGTISGACAALTRKISLGPHRIAAGVACAAIAAYVFSQANVARGANSCIFIQFVPVPAVWRGCS